MLNDFGRSPALSYAVFCYYIDPEKQFKQIALAYKSKGLTTMNWVCQVCGRRLSEDHKPDACPVCGAVSEYFISAEEYERPDDTLSEPAVADFNRAYALEVEATRIYNEANERARAEGDGLTALFFEALARNEHGHQVAIKYQKNLRGAGEKPGDP